HIASAEIDALAHADLRPGCAQPPRGAARQPQQRAAAILDQRGFDRRVEVEAHRKWRAGAAGQLVLAAQIVAVAREVKLPGVGHAKARAVAVVAGGDPLVAALLGALAAD